MTRAQTLPVIPQRFTPTPVPSLPTPSTVMTPIQPVLTSAVHTPISVIQPTTFVPQIPMLLNLQPPTKMDPSDISPYSVAECPRCHKVISTLGANLWLHMKECDPDHIMDYVHLLQEGKLATATLAEKEKADPYRIAHHNAEKRYHQNISYLRDIFSDTSVEDLVAWHGMFDKLLHNGINPLSASAPDRESEGRATVEAFTRAMEQMVGILSKHDPTLDVDEFQRTSATFNEHLARLDGCTTLEELETRKREFETAMGLRPEPEVRRVSRDSIDTEEQGTLLFIIAETPNLFAGGWGNGKDCNNNQDREMVDVSEPPPLTLVSL